MTAARVCHTGCVAFGMDRLAVALFATHGIKTDDVAGGRQKRARALIVFSRLRGRAGVDGHHRAGDIAAAVAEQEFDGPRHVLGSGSRRSALRRATCSR